MGGAIPRRMGLSCTRKAADREPGSQAVFLRSLCSSSCLRSCPDFPQRRSVSWKYKPKQTLSFPMFLMVKVFCLCQQQKSKLDHSPAPYCLELPGGRIEPPISVSFRKQLNRLPAGSTHLPGYSQPHPPLFPRAQLFSASPLRLSTRWDNSSSFLTSRTGRDLGSSCISGCIAPPLFGDFCGALTEPSVPPRKADSLLLW